MVTPTAPGILAPASNPFMYLAATIDNLTRSLEQRRKDIAYKGMSNSHTAKKTAMIEFEGLPTVGFGILNDATQVALQMDADDLRLRDPGPGYIKLADVPGGAQFVLFQFVGPADGLVTESGYGLFLERKIFDICVVMTDMQLSHFLQPQGPAVTAAQHKQLSEYRERITFSLLAQLI